MPPWAMHDCDFFFCIVVFSLPLPISQVKWGTTEAAVKRPPPIALNRRNTTHGDYACASDRQWGRG